METFFSTVKSELWDRFDSCGEAKMELFDYIEVFYNQRRPAFSHREVPMPFYLMRFSYTPDAWARLIKKPEDRREVARAVVEKLGGKLHGFWYGFGEHDGFVLIEAPNNVSAAAFSVGISARGSLRSADTTVLLTVEETIEMLEKTQDLPYRPPGASS
jgi:uncharacterized protein with GYD domain